MGERKVNEMDVEFIEYRVSEGNIIIEDIVIGSLFNLFRNIFDLYEVILDFGEGMTILIGAPSYGLAKVKTFLFLFFVCFY